MGGPFEAEYWCTIQTELTTLYSNLKTWEYMRRTPNMRVLPSTWTSKYKLCPDDEVTKFKACFVVCGDHQVEGFDYF